MQDNLSTSLAKIERVEAELKRGGERYEYAQELRQWMSDLVECLAVKSAIIEEMEEARWAQAAARGPVPGQRVG